VKHPNSNNIYSNLKPSANDLIQIPAVVDIVSPKLLGQILIDLKVKNNSYNEISDFCARILQLDINKAEMRDLILIVGERAKHLNGIYDELVQSKCKVIYLDEIFQGHSNCFIGATDSTSHYLFSIEKIINRSEVVIKETILNWGLNFENVQFVVTDGLPTYHQIVPLCFEAAIHVFCQVHAYRIILREQDEFHRSAEKAYSHLHDAELALESHRNAIHKKQQALWRKKKKRERIKKKQQDYYQKNGIKPYSKKALWTSERKAFKEELDNLRIGIKSQSDTIVRMQKEIQKLQQNLCRASEDYDKKKQISLQTGRLVRQFHDLMKCDSKEYPTERVRFQEILERSKYPIAKKINQFLIDHPELLVIKTLEFEKLCPPSVATTNILENIFNIFRPFFTKARHFGDNNVSNALFEILRLWYNTTPPYTGPNNSQSPLERVGIHAKSQNYLDLLFSPNGIQDQICRIFTIEKTRMHHKKGRRGSRASIIFSRSQRSELDLVI